MSLLGLIRIAFTDCPLSIAVAEPLADLTVAVNVSPSADTSKDPASSLSALSSGLPVATAIDFTFFAWRYLNRLREFNRYVVGLAPEVTG